VTHDTSRNCGETSDDHVVRAGVLERCEQGLNRAEQRLIG